MTDICFSLNAYMKYKSGDLTQGPLTTYCTNFFCSFQMQIIVFVSGPPLNFLLTVTLVVG